MGDYERIKNVMDVTGYPSAAAVWPKDGSPSLPDTFLIYNHISTVPESHYGDQRHADNRRFAVTIYARDGNLLDPLAATIRAGMEPRFLFIQESSDLHHEKTGHFARQLDFRIRHENWKE